MTRKDDEDGGLEALANLVAQATKTLPELVQRRDKLQAELALVNQKVNALMQYISAFQRPGSPPVVIPMPGGGHMQIGPTGIVQTPGTQAAGGGPHVVGAGGIPAHVLAALNQATHGMLGMPAAVPAPPQLTPSGRAPKGMVNTHVAVLMAGGGRYTLKSLRDEIKKRFGYEYGTSSIHRAVTAGVKDRRFRTDGNEYFKA